MTDIVSEADVAPLLRGAVRAGALEAALTDAGGKTLWSYGAAPRAGAETASLPLTLEGEPVGSVVVRGETGASEYLRGIAGLLRETLAAVLNTNLKRMLSTEIHTSVINISFDELLETNTKLRASEAKYRDLAENLEKKVAERTEELKRAHTRLLQREKMASVGRLAAGVAHEINNPLGFILSNLNTAGKYLSRMKEMLEFHQASLTRPGVPPEIRKAADTKRRELKLDLILGDIGQVIDQSVTGADRVKRIVSDLRGFSHIDETEVSPADINAELDKTLNVLGNEIASSAMIIRDYGSLKPFMCNPALLCQVFLNIVRNALEARTQGLELTIRTRLSDEGISVLFKDNGPGVPEEIRARIFDPFFTTKDVGSGTGMGLTVAYDIVSGLHGEIKLEDTPPGSGASFLITLPVS